MTDKAIISHSIDSLMSDIDKLKEQAYYTVYVPSLRKSVKFAPLEIKHQKDLLIAGSDPELAQFKFLTALNGVIVDCIVDKTIPILVTDRPLIALAIRDRCVSNTFNYIDEDGMSLKINLSEHINNRKKLKLLTRDKTWKVASDKIKLSCSIPTLIQDDRFNTYIYNKRPTDFAGAPPNTGDIFIGELAKFIDIIQIGEQSIDCRELLTPTQVVSILERLPMSITYELTEKLRPAREQELASVETDAEVIIPIDARLFT
jgi:hypothetical protein